MSDEKEFVNGLIIKAPRDNAPDFVKCSISIKRADLGNWLRGKSDEWINLDVKVSQNGKWYAEVNTWTPQQNTQQQSSQDFQHPEGFDDSSDIPF